MLLQIEMNQRESNERVNDNLEIDYSVACDRASEKLFRKINHQTIASLNH